MRGASGYIQPPHTYTMHTAPNRQAVTSELKDRKWSPISLIQMAVCVCDVDRQSLDVLQMSWTPTAARMSFFHVAFVKKEPIMMQCGTSFDQAGYIDQWVAEFKDRFISPRSSSFLFFFYGS